jgi:hypothetical protein
MKHSQEHVEKVVFRTIKMLKESQSDLELDSPVEHTVTIGGVYGESFRIVKTFLPEYYTVQTNDIEGIYYRNWTSEQFKSLIILDFIGFPIKSILYKNGSTVILAETFERDPNIMQIFSKDDIVFPDVDFRRYTILTPLGKGTYGSVYKVRHSDGTECAMKIIPCVDDNYPLDDGIPHTFIIEANITMELFENGVGPAIVEWWYAEIDGWMFGFIVMELWDGELQKKDRLNLSLVDKLVGQIKTIHKLGYVHGDIFSRNILIKRDEKGVISDVTLSDFGTVDTIPGWKKQLTGKWGQDFCDGFLRYTQTQPGLEAVNATVETIREDPTLLDTAFIHYLRSKMA